MKSATLFMLAWLLAAPPAVAQDVTPNAGRTAFQVCAACHGTKPGEQRVGPPLAGIAGRKVGSIEGFTYSANMAKATFTWDDERLSAFLAQPKDVVPGTRMIFRGMSDPAQRRAIIAYIKSLPSK